MRLAEVHNTGNCVLIIGDNKIAKDCSGGFQVSYAPFEDNGNFFYESLCRKGNKTDPPISVAFFKEYQKFIKV